MKSYHIHGRMKDVQFAFSAGCSVSVSVSAISIRDSHDILMPPRTL